MNEVLSKQKTGVISEPDKMVFSRVRKPCSQSGLLLKTSGVYTAREAVLALRRFFSFSPSSGFLFFLVARAAVPFSFLYYPTPFWHLIFNNQRCRSICTTKPCSVSEVQILLWMQVFFPLVTTYVPFTFLLSTLCSFLFSPHLIPVPCFYISIYSSPRLTWPAGGVTSWTLAKSKRANSILDVNFIFGKAICVLG